MSKIGRERLSPGVRVLLSMLAFYLFLKFLVRPPLPSSVIVLYMLLAGIGAVVYLTLFYNIKDAVITPLYTFLGGGVEGGMAKGGRLAVLVAAPLIVWVGSYQKFAAKIEPPLDPRVVHPAPPVEFTGLYSPFRVEDKEALRKYIAEGKEVYYRNCIPCHGDLLDGNGIFASGFNPKPANFQDPGVLPMLQESFLFWRVSTGGIGLPQESTPWNSAMPRWEEMLTDEQRWKVILFLSDYTGFVPRTWE
jgi:hypothetical protein